MKVRSAVIPAGGRGTRFLPATKSTPKELFPIGDQPAIQIVIDEALGAGLDHIVVVSSRSKPAIDHYFAAAPDIVSHLQAAGKETSAERLASLGREWQATVVYQDEPRGLGHAVGCAREAVGDEPFVVLLPDELVLSSDLLIQMKAVYADTGGSVVAVAWSPPEEVGAYGVINPSGPLSPDGVIPVKGLTEKPAAGQAPSNFILSGRYLLTPDIWDKIADLQPSHGGELQLTDALHAQADSSPFHAVIADGGRYDTGSPLGFLTASIKIGLSNPQLSDPLRSFLRQLELS